MIKVICDRCGNLVTGAFYDVLISEIDHIHPAHHKDDSEIGFIGGKGADFQLRFCVCSKCYREKLKLPNIHLCTDDEMVWRDEAVQKALKERENNG